MIHVLLISDDKSLMREVQEALGEGEASAFRVECMRRSKVRGYLQCDVCLVDMSSGRSGRRGSLEEVIGRLGGLPAIAVMESRDEEEAYKALRRGATDYVVRSELGTAMLGHAIERACLRMKVAEESGTYRGLKSRAEESEERYRAVVESAEEGIAVFDEAGLCHFINRASASRLGAKPGDLIGRTMWDLFPQELAEKQMKPVREVIRRGVPRVFETQSIIRGQPRWYHMKIVPLREGREGTTKALIMASDITEARRTEEALREREESAQGFLAVLKKLQEVTAALSKTQSLDELCRRAVELARSELGYDRMGIWLLEEGEKAFRGSYGVDEAGRLRDERSDRIPMVEGSPWAEIVWKGERLVVGEGALQDNARRTVGSGSSVFAGLWDGERVIGVMTVDNLLRGRPITQDHAELVALYASSVGHLCSIRHREDAAHEFLGRLMSLHDVSATLARTKSLDALFRRAVELGRERLGFDRLGVWLVGEEPHVLRGTFGTDEQGAVCDERKRRHEHPGGKPWAPILAEERVASVQRDETLRDSTGEPIAQGDFASASLWDGDKVFGSMVLDNLLSREPITEAQCRVLTLYAATVGSLCTIRRGGEELHESEERYRTLVEYSPDAIVLIDAEAHRFVDANGNAEALFGLSRQELLRKGPVDVSPAFQVDGSASAEAAELRIRWALAGETEPFEWVHCNAIGEEVPCEVRLVRVPPADRPLVRASITDITARKRAERTIAEQRAKMISASRLSSLGVMASGVAHEINNPLAIIAGGAEQLEELVRANDVQGERVEKVTGSIRRNVSRIERIIRGLRNLSRDSGKDPFRTVRVKALVDDALELCRARFHAHNITLEVGAIPESVEVECRSTLVSQVVLNLLNNSYDAVVDLPGPWIRLYYEEVADGVELSVTDSGEGVPPSLEERVFEPFFSTKEVGRGTGLGLSISKGIIDSHHGTLRIDTDSRNTRFVLRLPKRQPSMGSAP